MHKGTLALNIFGIKLILQGNEGTHSISSIAYVSGAYLNTSYKNGRYSCYKLSLGYKGSSMYLVELHIGF
jgi:hypothetical protein